jgi:hypothetical protein
MGHLWIKCLRCEREHRETVLFEPPHDITHQDPGPWPR